MKIGGTVIFKDKTGEWIRTTTEKLDVALKSMGESIKNTATMLAPVDSGDLRSTGRVEMTGENEVKITFGGTANGVNVKYARRRHYENNKNPQTKYYLQRAGNQVSKKGIKPYL